MDAPPKGDRSPWMRYLDERIVYPAEDGKVKTKDDLVKEVEPFPKEIELVCLALYAVPRTAVLGAVL